MAFTYACSDYPGMAPVSWSVYRGGWGWAVATHQTPCPGSPQWRPHWVVRGRQEYHQGPHHQRL